MIVYDLKCCNDHVFEAWFRDSASCQAQTRAGKVDCPVCGESKVEKAPMAPNVAVRKESTGRELAARAAALEVLGEMRHQVEQNCDYVGPEFAEEARKIHHGEVDQRNIYGEATPEEASELSEEGVEFKQVPWVETADN